jgi:hypothetical protein
MATFITRVELYGSPSEDVYTRLHRAMSTAGFTRTFTDSSKKYEFPHAMYGMFNSTEPTTRVLELARQATAPIWRDFGVLVTKTEVRFEHYNLIEVK